jgi:hypothetical protein
MKKHSMRRLEVHSMIVPSAETLLVVWGECGVVARQIQSAPATVWLGIFSVRHPSVF